MGPEGAESGSGSDHEMNELLGVTRPGVSESEDDILVDGLLNRDKINDDSQNNHGPGDILLAEVDLISEAHLFQGPNRPLIEQNVNNQGARESEVGREVNKNLQAQLFLAESPVPRSERISTSSIEKRGVDELQQKNKQPPKGILKRNQKLSEKQVEKEKWSAFVGDMISEDDRAEARRDLRAIEDQGFVCQGLVDSREEAAKIWDFGKKMGMVSVDSNKDVASMLLGLDEADRRNDGLARESQIDVSL